MKIQNNDQAVPKISVVTHVNHTGKVTIKRPVLRHKMYKAGKTWMVAGIVGLTTAGTMVITSGQAHADTTSTAGTTAVTSGGNPTSSYTQVNVDSSGVTSAANAASQAGVKVTQTSGTTYNVQGSAQLNSATSAVASDYANQTSALNSATVQAQNSNANSSAVAALNNQVSAVTSAAEAAGVTVNSGSTIVIGSAGITLAQAQAQIQSAQASASAAVSSATATVKSANAVASAVTTATSNAKSEAASAAAAGVKVNSATKVVSSVAEANSIASENKANVASAKAEVDRIPKTDVIENNADSAYTGEGTVTVTYRTVVQGNITATVSGNGTDWKSYGITVTGIDDAHIVSSINVDANRLIFPWGGATENLPMTNSTNIGSATIPSYDYKASGATKVWGVKSGTWAFDPQAVTLKDGSKQGLWVRVGSDSDSWPGEEIALYVTADGSIETVVGGKYDPANHLVGYNTNKNNMTFVIADRSGNDHGQKYLLAQWVYDLDGGQQMSFGSGTNATDGKLDDGSWAAITAVGGGVKNSTAKIVNSGNVVVKADPNLGMTYGKNMSKASALNGVNSLPDGGALLVTYGNHFNSTVSNMNDAPSIGVDQGMFGSTAAAAIKTIETTITIPTFTPKDTKPITLPKYVTGTPETPTATYHINTINYTQTGQKTVTDTQNGTTTNINGDVVTKGDTIQYTGTTSDLPANRTNNITNVSFNDTVPAGVTVNSVKVYSATGEDITNEFNVTTTTDANGSHVVNAVSTNATLLNAMNHDKASSYRMPYIVINGTVNADNATLDNKIVVKINGTSVTTNTVENKTPNPTPNKSETTNGGTEDTNGKIVQKGDTINYKIGLDYSGITSKTAISDSQKVKGLSMTDNYDPKTTAVQNSLTVKDANGNAIPASYYTVTWDAGNHKLTLKWNNVDSFLKAYGGQKLTVAFNATVNQDVTDASTIKNGATQINFGQNYATNVVTNTIDVPKPTKSETTNGGSENTDGKIVQKGDTINYTVNWDLSGVTAANTSKAQQSLEWSLSDNYDSKTTANQASLKVYTASGQVVPSSAYTVTWNAANHSFTIKINNPAAFLATYGNQILKAKFDAAVNQNIADLSTISNTAYQTDAGQKYTTNTVTNHTPGMDIHKIVTENGTTTNADAKIVQKGDTLNYSWTWDLSGVTSSVLSNAQKTQAWNTYDNYDPKTTANQSTLWIKDASGKAVDASYYTVTWDAANHKVTISVKDPAAFFAKYGNQKLTVGFDATANADVKTGDTIKNTAFQTDAGHVYKSNTVTNVVDNPQPSKSETENGGTEDSNGKLLQRGDTINYKVTWDLSGVSSSTITTDQVAKGLGLTDNYDAKTTADESTLALKDAKGNIIPASSYKVTWDTANHKLMITPNSTSDWIKNYGGQKLTLTFNATVNNTDKNGDEIKNTAVQNEFGHDYSTNTVTNKVDVPNPTKSETTNGGTEDTNGKIVQKGDTINYTINWDLSDVTGSNTTKADQAKEWSLSDNYDAKTTATQSSLKVYTASGEVVPTTAYTVTWDTANHSFVIKVNNPATFLAKYGDQVLKVKFDAVVNQDVKDAAQIDNTAYQTDAGQKYTTNTVTNTIDVPNTEKSVTENGGTTSANGSIVQQGDTLNYSWTWDLSGVTASNTSKAQQTLAWNTYDTYDAKTTPDQSTIWVKDASGNTVNASYYTVTWDAANHKVTIAVKDPASFLAKYGNQILKVGFDAIVNTDGIKNGDEIKNTAFQTNAGHVYQTNTVINHYDNPTPNKSETVDGNNEDGNGKNVLKGDTINYKITWDLTADTTATVNADQIAKGMGLYDSYDAKTTADQSSIIITDAKGNTIPTSAYTVTWDAANYRLTIVPTSVSDFLKSYGGQILTVKFNAKVNQDVKDGDEIKNTAYQNEFGHIYVTNTVTNKVKVPEPKKDVVVSVDNNKSLNNSTIGLNQEFDYALKGGEVPQGYAGKLTEYGFSDDYDQEHDQYDGQYTILADQDVYLTDGTVIKKGTDLAQYATQTIDQTNGKVTIELSKAFLSKIDFTKGGFSATVYLAMKRIKAGTVYNMYNNTINNVVYKSNTVKTTTLEPKAPEKPVTPKPSTPVTPTSTPATPASATPVATVPTPAPAQHQKQLPQTGNDASLEKILGLGIIGLTGMMALGLRKKRYGE